MAGEVQNPDQDGRNLVFVSDGTLSTLTPQAETNAGLLYRLLDQTGPNTSQRFDYDAGVQGTGLGKWFNAITGMGINLSICQGYSFLASRYRPGDRIYLFGYSRGAYAVRSLAGMIGSVGLLKRDHATERNVKRVFRLYEHKADNATRAHFQLRHCHIQTPIEMLGVWDTVKALGLPYPMLSRLGRMATEFHDHSLGRHIRHGYHALAIDEDRGAYSPILWQRSENWEGRLEQAWFPGTHRDVGGDIRAVIQARPLANIPLNWILRHAVRHGLILPGNWQAQFPKDAAAPHVSNRHGAARMFLLRHPRATGSGDGEIIHLSIRDRIAKLPGYHPVGRIDGG